MTLKLIILLLILGLSFSLFFIFKEKENLNFSYGQLADQKIKLWLADTPLKRQKGLSNWPVLPEGEGMLFIFPQPHYPQFWMKEMNFAIDIIWLNEKKEIIGIESDLSPDTFPTLFSPSEPSQYVLELPAGFSQKNSLQIGDQLKID